MEDIRRPLRPKMLSAADGQYLKVIFLRNRGKKPSKDLIQDLHSALQVLHLLSQWKGACEEAILKKHDD